MTSRKKSLGEQLREAVSLQQATLEATADGILIVDLEGKWSTYNRQFAGMWRIPDDILQAGDDKRALDYVLEQLAEPQAFIDKVMELYAHPQAESFDVLHFKDGRVFERYSKEQRIGDEIVGRVWSFRDVTERRHAEEKLRRSEERFSLAMAGANDALWDWNLKTDEVYYSPRWFSMVGYKPDELPATLETWTKLVHPDDKERVLQHVSDYLEGKIDTYKVEMRLRHKDGHHVIVLSRATKVSSDSTNKPDRLIGTHVDITEHKKTEKKLSKELSFRDQLLDRAAEGIVVWRLTHSDTFAEFITWNRRMQEITGYTKEEINSIGWLNAVYDDESQRTKARKTMLQVIEGTTNHGKDFTAVTKSGAHRVLHIASSPISGENNEPCVLAIVEDVTERKQQELLLASSMRRFQTLFDSSTDGIFILDMKGNFIDLNRTAHERLGYSKEEMMATSVKALDPPEFAEKVPMRMKQIIENGSAVFESAHYRKDGSIMPVEINARLLDLQGEQIVLSIVRDISERKTLEEQLRHSQKMESIGTLVGGIAHDFNNMLAAVLGNVYLAKRQMQEQLLIEDKLDNIEKLSNRAANMVRQLLTFARKDIVEMRVVNLNRFMEEGYALARTAIPESVDHKTSICEKSLNIIGDATQLQQAIFNLLSNAIDAVAEASQPKIRCSLEHFEVDQPFLHNHPGVRGTEFARITVKDNGLGIPSGHINQIFEPFFTTKEVGKGTGLGLSMLYGAVQTHDGIVEVESEPGSGTSIHVYLPLSKKSPELLPDQQISDSTQSDLTILLVDDEDDLRLTTAQVLIEMGYRVVEAADGEAALERFKSGKHEISLVLTDVIMPKMGGMKLLQAIRELDANIPVILTTGYDDTVLDSDFRATLCEVMRKPFDFEQLSSRIRSMIKESKT